MKKYIPNFISKKYSQNKFKGNFTGTILYADIVGFTSVTNELMKNGKVGAEVLAEIITNLFSPSLNLVHKHNGFVISVLGDAFIAVFWNSEDSINAAEEICLVFEEKGNRQTEIGKFEFSIKVGISSSKLNWKIIRNIHQNAFVFNSLSLKLSSELQKLCSPNSFLTDGIDLRQQPEFSENKEYSQSSFIPESLKDPGTEGEFRKVVSCFVHFGKHQNLISKIIDFVHLYGGFIKDIDFIEKRIFVVFGAPRSPEKIFDSAMNFTVDLKKHFPEELKFGMSYGTAFVGFIESKFKTEYVVIGKSVNFAARLVSGAKKGEILIDEQMSKNISNSSAFIGNRKFKGFSQTVSAYRIISDSEIKSKASVRFIGRKKEMQILQTIIDEVSTENKSRTVYISGSAGIGKSRLAAELKRQNEKYNWCTLPCDEVLQKSFSPIAHFLKEYFSDKKTFTSEYKTLINSVSNSNIKNELIRTESVIADLRNIRRKNSVFSQMDAKSKYTNTVFAVINFFIALASEKPLILQIEDVHKADNDTILLMQKLMAKAAPFPIILLMTCRQNSDGSPFELGIENAKRIEMEPLQKDEVVSFVNLNFDAVKLPAEIEKKVRNFCEGNPFYLEQLLIFLLENNLTLEDVNSAVIPPNINSLIISRIDALSNDLKKTVKTASVLGREFAVNILSLMLKELPINEYLAEGENRNIWNVFKKLNYIFQHSLIRESVYDMQLGKHLKELHKLAAETIETTYSDNKNYFSDIAFHYERAGVLPKAIEYLLLSGNVAKDKYQNEAAINFYQRIIDLIGKNADEKKVEILLKQGKIYRLLGKSKKAKINFEKAMKSAIELKDEKLIAVVKSSLGLHFKRQGKPKIALKYFTQVLEFFEGDSGSTNLFNALLDLGGLHTSCDEYKKAEQFYQRALNIAKDLKDAELLSLVYGEYGILLKKKGSYEKSLRFFQMKIKLSKKTVNIRSIAYAYNNIGNLQMNKGEYHNSELSFNKALKIVRKIGDKFAEGMITGNLGIIYMDTGRKIKAMNHYNKSLEICEEIGDKIGIAVNNGNLAIVLKNLGRLDEALKCVRKRIEMNKELGDISGTAFAYGNLGNIQLEQGRLDKAEASYKEMLKIAEEINYKIGIALAKGNLANIYAEIGKPETAMKYYNEEIVLERELDLKTHLVQSLNDKARLLLRSGKPEEAEKIIKETLMICKKIKSTESFFAAEITSTEIEFRVSKTKSGKNSVVNKLELKLENCKSIYSKAVIHSKLGSFYQQIEDIQNSILHRKQAIRIYKKLYKKKPFFSFLNSIIKLEKAIKTP